MQVLIDEKKNICWFCTFTFLSTYNFKMILIFLKYSVLKKIEIKNNEILDSNEIQKI